MEREHWVLLFSGPFISASLHTSKIFNRLHSHLVPPLHNILCNALHTLHFFCASHCTLHSGPNSPCTRNMLIFYNFHVWHAT